MLLFYTGTAVVIYRADKGDHGTMYKIVPETVNFTYNQRTCFEIPGFKEAPVTVQGVLPDMSLYKVHVHVYVWKLCICVQCSPWA